MLHVFGGGRNRGSSSCTLSVARWVSSLWDLSLSLMGISWVQPSKVRDVVVAWRRRMKTSWVLGVWNMIPLAIWWATWKERNRRIFEDKSLSFQDFKLYFLRLLYSWNVGLCDGKELNFLAFIDCIMDESLRA